MPPILALIFMPVLPHDDYEQSAGEFWIDASKFGVDLHASLTHDYERSAGEFLLLLLRLLILSEY